MKNIINSSSPLFSRIWEMPNSNTFDIKCIRRLIYKYFKPEFDSIDPFANNSKLAKITNDLNPEMDTDYHLDAVDFMKQYTCNSMDFVFYDPPYSLRQVKECYNHIGKQITTNETNNFRTSHINEISRIVRPNGLVMCFGWNSSGIGKIRGFELIEILMVCHGGSHNDTICTVERKLKTLF